MLLDFLFLVTHNFSVYMFTSSFYFREARFLLFIFFYWLQLERSKQCWPPCACGTFVGKMKCYGKFKTILKSNNTAMRVSAIPQWLVLQPQLWHSFGKQTNRAKHLSKQFLSLNKYRDGSAEWITHQGLGKKDELLWANAGEFNDSLGTCSHLWVSGGLNLGNSQMWNCQSSWKRQNLCMAFRKQFWHERNTGN